MQNKIGGGARPGSQFKRIILHRVNFKPRFRFFQEARETAKVPIGSMATVLTGDLRGGGITGGGYDLTVNYDCWFAKFDRQAFCVCALNSLGVFY